MIQFERVFILCELPNKILRDEQNRLHSDSKSAISWTDGYELYFIHGRRMPGWIWKEKDSITKEQFLSETNAEINEIFDEEDENYTIPNKTLH